jgi:hypothetical protein
VRSALSIEQITIIKDKAQKISRFFRKSPKASSKLDEEQGLNIFYFSGLISSADLFQ